MAHDPTILENQSLIKLKTLFDQKLGAGTWASFEPETILLEIEAGSSDLLIDKISILRILESAPTLAYTDPGLFLHAAEVINNQVADFTIVPHVTMLEAAYAVHTIDAILRLNKVSVTYPEALVKTCSYILRQDGCSEPIPPFTFVPETELVAGQLKEDTDKKKLAISTYITHMDSL
jgi:hypothetical protein